MKRELPKAYDAQKVEDGIYKEWEDSGFFNPDRLPGERKQGFSISMPPPNATGTLHIGHAMFLTIQDLIIRYQRMLGKKALWLPGTDHAAIATQTKVEKMLKSEGKSKYDFTREEFLRRVDEYVRGSQNTIRNQIRKMGSSCDWSRERFTLDEGLSRAVRHAFVAMYNDGLIYRGQRIVNWCPRCESTLADDEVEYQEKTGKFYYFRYGPIVIGTVRPETKFLDKTIVVHPSDDRYKDIVGKHFDVEWIEGSVRANVIADEIVDREFGSGAMTITPAHSFEDFDLAQKHGLSIDKIIDEKGNFTKAAGSFSGKNARESREDIVKILEKKGLLEKVDENYKYNLSVCYRCQTPIEPMPSKQWFVSVNSPVKTLGGKSLKEKAIESVRSGEIKIIPERFNRSYFRWMENLHDWCISRQIWYGHRIPVWYCMKCENTEMKPKESEIGVYNDVDILLKRADVVCPIVAIYEKDVKCPQCGETDRKYLLQDPDTLDTWFSSGLWTFSTLGWPEKTKDLKEFHPTSAMETGYDILFFWVARMVLMSNYFMREVPFKEVYLHGLVRDEKGKKMSKSLDNIIDPLDLIPKYGTDAIRLSLLIGITPGNDVNLGEGKIAGYRNFVNKLWNISRYVLMSVNEPRLIETAPKPLTLSDEWILAKLETLKETISADLDKYAFSHAGEALYEFTWKDFADWYIEIAKIEKGKDKMLLYVLQNILKLWHPFCPFVTEEIWKQLKTKSVLMVESWPMVEKSEQRPKEAINDFSQIQGLVSAIRNMRSEAGVEPAKKITAVVVAHGKEKLMNEQKAVIMSLARLSDLRIEKNAQKPDNALSAVVFGMEIHIEFSDIIDTEKEKKNLQRQIDEISNYIERVKAKLDNKDFTSRAPEHIVAAEREKLEKEREKLAKLKDNMGSL